MQPQVPQNSPYYPFRQVIKSNQLTGAELIPYKILMYLLDLPDAYCYNPPDNNDYPRCRLNKYLWHDCANPLAQPLPTPQEKRSMLFNPEQPDINTDEQKAAHPQGYRLFAQRIIGQSNIEAKTMLKVYPGRVLDTNSFRTVIGMQAEIWSDVNLITNTKTTTYDRVWAIEQCLREALSGVDIAGVGTVHFDRVDGSFNGSELLYTDSTMAGRLVYFSLAWSDSKGESVPQA